MRFSDELYGQLLNEVGRNEPNYVKVMKWAVGLHFNSGSQKDGIDPAKIGYYFSTIFFKDWKANYEPKEGRPAQLALFYTGTYKTHFASTGAEDARPYTIVYAVEDIEGIKQDIKDSFFLSAIFDMKDPRPNYQDNVVCSILHEMAKKYVRYAKVYWKNDETDALIVPQSRLDEFGTILKNSDLNIARTPIDKTHTRGFSNDYRVGDAFYTTIPLSQKKEFNINIVHKYLNAPYIEIKHKVGEFSNGDDKYETEHADNTSYSELKTVDDTNNDKLYIGVTADAWGRLLMQIIEREGFAKADDWTELNLRNKKGNVKKASIYNTALYGTLFNIVFNNGIEAPKKSGRRKPSSTGSSSGKTGGTSAVTIAAAAGDFAKIATLATAKVNVYKSSHPKSKAKLVRDDDAQSITIENVSQETIDSFCAFLDKKGLEYSKM